MTNEEKENRRVRYDQLSPSMQEWFDDIVYKDNEAYVKLKQKVEEAYAAIEEAFGPIG
jgi:hypothetical protein